MLAGSPGDSTLKRGCASSMRRPTDNEPAKQNAPRGAPTNEAGPGRGFTGVAARVLIDTNIINGIEELLSEDFQHGRMYGTVGVRNPFLALTEAS